MELPTDSSQASTCAGFCFLGIPSESGGGRPSIALRCNVAKKRGMWQQKLLFTPLHLILHSIGGYGFALQRRFFKSKINFKESLGSLGSGSFYPELAFSNYS